jgi:hypothetical protein
MPKKKFSHAERYSVWLHNQRRCWWCEVPLRLAEVTVDHVIPEFLEETPEKLSKLLSEYDLPKDFQVNGFENWLPAHSHCNSEKSTRVFKLVPAYRPVFSHLIRTSAKAKRTADAVKRNVVKDKLLVKLATAIDENEVSLTDLTDFLDLFGVQSNVPTSQLAQGSSCFKLDNGYWLRREDIAAEGFCDCERSTCVGQDEKVYCYFPSHLSSWVIGRRLYHRCYDEIIQCPRCSATHRRGYVGRAGSCARPYSDQEHQVDTQGSEAK